MQCKFPEEYCFLPETWNLPEEFAQVTRRLDCPTFIVKPSAKCQGKGIYLLKDLQQLSHAQQYIIQEYIEDPCLLNGLKFDFRIYCLVSACDPLRIYVFEEGLARLATEPYEQPCAENLSNLYMHLTNYAINKENPKFLFNKHADNMSVGHKRALSEVFKHLKDRGVDICALRAQIDDILVKTLIAGQPTLASCYQACQTDNYERNMCFELLGFDILLDARYQPHLIEVNHTPSFTTDTPLDSFIKERLVTDTLALLNVSLEGGRAAKQKHKLIIQQKLTSGKK